MADLGWRHRVPAAARLAVLLAAFLLLSLRGLGCGSDDDGALVAHAGEDQAVLVGRPARLDGSLSRHTGGQPIEHHWSIAERPLASRAALVLESDVRPTFVPDHPGTYVFELAVSAGNGISRPVRVTATADYAPADFVYVDSRVVAGAATDIGSYQISLGLSPNVGAGPTRYPAPPFSTYTGGPVGFHVMVLNRGDGTVRSHKSYPVTTLDQANALATDLSALTADHLVLVSSLQFPAAKKITDLCGSTDPTRCLLLGALEKIGASTQVGSVGASAMLAPESYSLIGFGAVGAGNGYERWSGNVPGDASIAGVLLRDSLQAFGFTYEYVPFETRTSAASTGAPPDSIVVGDVVYPLPAALPDANSGGFHVLVLDRSTLAPLSHQLYVVNRSGARDATQVKTLGSDLYAVAKAYDKLVIVSAVGVLPTMRAFKSDGQRLEWAVDLLGGRPGIIPKLVAGDTYSLVGIGPGTAYPRSHWRLPEPGYPILSVDASSVEAPGLEANIRGLLKKDRQGWFVPTLSDPSGSATGIDYSLLTIALREPVPWRGPDTEAEKQVYADISRYLFTGLNLTHPDDMRLYYYRNLSWPSLYAILHGLTCEQLYQVATCPVETQQAFATMHAYLDQEVLYRNLLQDWFNNDLAQLLDGLEQTNVIDLATAYQNAMDQAQVGPTFTVLLKVADLLYDITWLGSRFGEFGSEGPIPKEVGAAFGVISAVIRLGMDFIPSPSDGVPGEVKEAAAQLWIDVLETYINTTATTNQAMLYITEDWGRLEAFHAVYTSLYDYTRYRAVLEAMEPGITASFYRALLPVAFRRLTMPLTTAYLNYDCNTNSPCDYYACRSGGSINYYESNHCAFSSSQGAYRPADALESVENLSFSSTPCTTSSPRHSYYTIWKGGGQSVSDYYSDRDIKLFPAVPDGGLGVSRLEFFTRWPFTYEFNGHWNDGCNCSPGTHLCPD